jgi:NAD(P)-dependent dehydrogenase (short-subunit alcohol dehydrogenase family)
LAFHGKVALIVGGASGMGKVAALRLAAQSAKVAVADINEQSLEAIAREDKNITPYRLDVTQPTQVEEMVGRVVSELGPIDRFVHTAAIMPGMPIMDMPAETINRVMTINYFGMVNVTKAVLPAMLKRGSGDVILYGSSAGEVFCHNMGAYCASKAANNAFAEVLYHEHKNSGLRFVLVCPPAVDTPLVDQLVVETGPKAMKDAARKGNMLSPEKVVDAVEKAIEKGKFKIYPGSAGPTVLMHRLAPGLLWKIVERMNT